MLKILPILLALALFASPAKAGLLDSILSPIAAAGEALAFLGSPDAANAYRCGSGKTGSITDVNDQQVVSTAGLVVRTSWSCVEPDGTRDHPSAGEREDRENGKDDCDR